MKYKVVISIILITLLCGCAGLLSRNKGITGKNTSAENKQHDKIELVDDQLRTNDHLKLIRIGEYSYGVDYTLRHATNKESLIAYDLNKRIISLAEQPSLSSVIEIERMVNDLWTNNTKRLETKDKEIINLQNKINLLESQKEIEIQKYMDLAQVTAGKADQYKATLSEMDSLFGLGAVWYGLKKFFFSSMVIIIVIGILFLFLRILSSSNPIAASIFSIFEHMISWIINSLKVIAPKAFNLSKLVGKEVYDSSHLLLAKITDSIQWLKEIEKTTNKEITLRQLLDELSKKMNDSDKIMIDKIKKELNY